MAEGKYSQDLLARLSQISKERQANDAQFTYLKELNAIRALDDDKKPSAVNIDQRRAKNQEIENRTLAAENARRQAMGEVPYTSWATYQASQDALAEERGAMKESLRPKLPESEAYVLEAARLMFDAKR